MDKLMGRGSVNKRKAQRKRERGRERHTQDGKRQRDR